MSRYKGLILSCVSVLMIVCCVCSFSFESKAADITTFDILSDRPMANEYSGYIEIYGTRNSDGYKAVKVMKWYCQNFNSPGTPYVDMYIASSGHISFVSNVCEAISIYYISSDGMDTWERIYDGALGSSAFYPDFMSAYTINSYRIYGNVASATDNLTSYNSQQFTVAYNLEINQYKELQKIYSELLEANANDQTMINKINQIYNSVDTVESKLEQLIDLQKETNNWLQKIWNSIQEFLTPDDKDKEESDKLESETNDKTDKLDDLNEQNKTDKVDVDNASDSVDENVDLESIGTVNNIFVYITENEYILQMLLMVFSVALVAYVLFGKK